MWQIFRIQSFLHTYELKQVIIYLFNLACCVLPFQAILKCTAQQLKCLIATFIDMYKCMSVPSCVFYWKTFYTIWADILCSKHIPNTFLFRQNTCEKFKYLGVIRLLNGLSSVKLSSALVNISCAGNTWIYKAQVSLILLSLDSCHKQYFLSFIVLACKFESEIKSRLFILQD